MSSIVHDGPSVYLNADRSAVVDGGSPSAAFLLVASGGTVHPRLADLYQRLVVDAEEPRDEPATTDDEPVTQDDEPAATRKPRKRSAARK